VERDLLKTHVGTDEVDLNSSGEISPRPLNRVISGFGPRSLMALEALLVGVAVAGDGVGGLLLFFSILAAPCGVVGHDDLLALAGLLERGCAHGRAASEDVDVPFLDELGKELQEEGNHEQADVHAVDIGIGGDDDLVVSQSVEAVLNVECSLQQIELLVLIDHLFCQAETVERLAAQAEHRLRVDVAALGDGLRWPSRPR
jgi:hypothetical protein